MRLLGKVAVVTGAAVGLGRAIATRFAHEGASVIAADTNVTEGEELVRDLSEHGHNAMFVEADVAKNDAVQNLFAAVPGTMDTPLNHSVLSDQESRDELRRAVPMGRLGKPDDVEGLAVFLASDESAYCTGGLYMCDGGLTAV